MKHIKLLIFLLSVFILFSCENDDNGNTSTPQNETVLDVDGNLYNTITIGNQVWMLENLKTTKFNDGTAITQWTPGEDWGALTSQQTFYQWGDTTDPFDLFEEELPFDFFGAEYNHFALESGKLAPEGWRIPTEQDFIELENYLSNNGFSGNESTALKSTTSWANPSNSGTNAIGFNALPNGLADASGTVIGRHLLCNWVTADLADGPVNSSLTRKNIMLDGEPTFTYVNNSIILSSGVRCIKE